MFYFKKFNELVWAIPPKAEPSLMKVLHKLISMSVSSTLQKIKQAEENMNSATKKKREEMEKKIHKHIQGYEQQYHDIQNQLGDEIEMILMETRKKMKKIKQETEIQLKKDLKKIQDIPESKKQKALQLLLQKIGLSS